MVSAFYHRLRYCQANELAIVIVLLIHWCASLKTSTSVDGCYSRLLLGMKRGMAFDCPQQTSAVPWHRCTFTKTTGLHVRCGSNSARVSKLNRLALHAGTSSTAEPSPWASSGPTGFPGSNGLWYSMDDCQVLLPSIEYLVPKAIIHFTGGFLAGAAAPLAYGPLLDYLSARGFLIVSTSYDPFNTNHGESAIKISQKFCKCYQNSIYAMYGQATAEIPIIGLTHSLGGKLAAIMHARREDRKRLPPRTANVFMAFNNYGVEQSFQYSTAQVTDALQKFDVQKSIPNVQDIKKAAKQATKSAIEGSMQTSPSMGSLFRSIFNEWDEEDTDAVDRWGKTSPTGQGGMMARTLSEIGSMVQLSVETITDSVKSTMESNSEWKDILQQMLASFPRPDKEFTPDPMMTWRMILDSYNIQDNYLVRFASDDIDQSYDLKYWLEKRGCDVNVVTLPGNHLAPVSLMPGAVVSSYSADTADIRQQRTDAGASPLSNLSRELELLLNTICSQGISTGSRSDRTANEWQLPAAAAESTPNIQPRVDEQTWDDDSF